MKAHAQKFRVPDKPGNENAVNSTPKRMMSKLNSITRQFTGSSVDNPDYNADDPSIPPEMSNGDIPKSDSSHSLDIPNSRVLWRATPRPDNSSQYYHFTSFSMSLNELNDSIAKTLPPTDSRLRPDVRKLEEGDLGK